MLSLKDGSEVETVPNASEFLGDTLNIRDDDSALVYCVPKYKETVLVELSEDTSLT
jgi:hypothetical protein